MAFPTAEEYADMLKTNLLKLNKKKVVECAAEFTGYLAQKWITKKKSRIIKGGRGDQWTIWDTIPEDAARFKNPLEPDDTNITPLLKQASITWRHCETNWSYHYIYDVLMNKNDPDRIATEMEVREAASNLALLKLLEGKLFGAPPGSSDTTNPLNIRYWIVTNATDGFNGGAPSGHTTVAGIDPSTNEWWKNYTFTSSDFSYEQFSEKLSDAIYSTDWKAPVPFSQNMLPDDVEHELMGPRYVHNQAKRLVRSQNDQNGRDIDAYEKDGAMMLCGKPLMVVPYLDTAGSGGVPLNQLFGIDHSSFHTIILDGDNMRNTGPLRSSNNKDLYQVFKTLTMNVVCRNRRRQFVGSLPAAS